MTAPFIPSNSDQSSLVRQVQELSSIVRGLEERLKPGINNEWTLTNVTADTALDADSTSTAELADVVGTLIQQLQDSGIIR